MKKPLTLSRTLWESRIERAGKWKSREIVISCILRTDSACFRARCSLAEWADARSCRWGRILIPHLRHPLSRKQRPSLLEFSEKKYCLDLFVSWSLLFTMSSWQLICAWERFLISMYLLCAIDFATIVCGIDSNYRTFPSNSSSIAALHASQNRADVDLSSEQRFGSERDICRPGRIIDFLYSTCRIDAFFLDNSLLWPTDYAKWYFQRKREKFEKTYSISSYYKLHISLETYSIDSSFRTFSPY